MTAAAAAGGINLTTLWVNVAPSLAGMAGAMAGHGQTAANNFSQGFNRNWEDYLDTATRSFEGSVRNMATIGTGILNDMFAGTVPKAPDIGDFTAMFQSIEGMGAAAASKMTELFVGWVPIFGDVATKFVDSWTGAFQDVTGLAGELTNVFYEMGNAWQEVGRKILGVTGATRTELENYMTVVQQILAGGNIVEMGDVVDAIGIIGDRMEGINNTQLRAFTTIVAQAQELLGNINVSQMVAALNQWGISAEDAAGKFAGLVHVAQDTKTPFDTITRQLVQAGPILGEFGLNFDQVALFMGKMGELGFPLERFAYQFQRAAGDITKAGMPLKGALTDVFEQVDRLLSGGNDVQATKYLNDLFGPYGWPRIIAMMRERKEAFAGLVSEGSAGLNADVDEISDQVNRTADVGEQFIVIRNRIMADLRVMSQGFADHLTQAGDNLQNWTATHHTQVLQVAQDFANGMITGVQAISGATAAAVGIVAPMLNPVVDLTTSWAQSIIALFETISRGASLLPDWAIPGGSGDWKQFADQLHKAGDALEGVQGIDFSKYASNISDGLNKFSNEMLPDFREWVNNSMDPLIDLSAAFDDLADNVEALPEQKTFRIVGTGQREMEEGLKKIGITFDKTADGTVTKVKAANAQIADDFQAWWEQNQGKELDVNLVVTPTDASGNPISSATDALPTAPPGTPLGPGGVPMIPQIPTTIPGVAAPPAAALPQTAATTGNAESVQRAIIAKAQAMGFTPEQILAALAVANQETGYGTNPRTNVVQNQNGTPGITGVYQQDMYYRKYGDPRDPNNAITGFLTEFANRGEGLKNPDPWAQAVAEVQKPANVGAGGYWDRSGAGAGEYLKQQQRAQALEVYNKLTGGGGTLPTVPTTVLPTAGLPTAPLPTAPVTTTPVTTAPVAPVAPKGPLTYVEEAKGWVDGSGNVFSDKDGKTPTGATWRGPGKYTPPPAAPAATAAATPTGIIPPSGLPLAPLPPVTPGAAAPGGTPTAPPLPTGNTGSWQTDSSSGWRYWTSPTGATFTVPPDLPLPEIPKDGSPPIAGSGYHWGATQPRPGFTVWVLISDRPSEGLPPVDKPPEKVNPQVGEPDVGTSGPGTEAAPPPLTAAMVSGPAARPGASPFAKTGTLGVAITTVVADGKTWIRYTFPDGTQYWATPAYLSQNPKGVTTDDYTLSEPWFWANTNNAGVYYSANRKVSSQVAPTLPDIGAYTSGDNPPAATGPGTGPGGSPADILQGALTGAPMVSTTNGSTATTAPPSRRVGPPPIPLGPDLTIAPANPPAPALPSEPPNWWPENKLPRLPDGYHWEPGNSRWEIIENGRQLDPTQRRQGQYHKGGRVTGLLNGGRPDDGLWRELLPDEFVVNRDVAMNNMEKLDALNKTGKWPGFDSGGSVGSQFEEWLKKNPNAATTFAGLGPSLKPTQSARAAGSAPLAPNTSDTNSLGLGPTPNVNAGRGSANQQRLTDFSAGVSDSASSTVLGTVNAVMNPTDTAKALAPLIGAGGSGAPGVGESWLRLGKGVTHWDQWADNPWGAAGATSFDIGSMLAGSPGALRATSAAGSATQRGLYNMLTAGAEPAFAATSIPGRLVPLPVGNLGRTAADVAEASGETSGLMLDPSLIREVSRVPETNIMPIINSKLTAGLPGMRKPAGTYSSAAGFIDHIWQEGLVWNHYKDYIRAGYADAMKNGSPGIDEAELTRRMADVRTYPTDPNIPLESWVPTPTAEEIEALHMMGAELAARATSSPMTNLPLDRGMMVTPEILAALQDARQVSFGLSSFGTRPVGPDIHNLTPSPVPSQLAAGFSGTRSAMAGNAWVQRQLTRLKSQGNTEGVIFSVLPGAQASRMSANEQALAGTFGIANIIPPSMVDRGVYGPRADRVATIIELYQKSLLENPRYAIGRQSGGGMSGVVPYYGEIGRDSVHAVLEPDEFVIKRPVAMKYTNELWHLNETGKWPSIEGQKKMFQEGGPVSPQIQMVQQLASQFGLTMTSGMRDWAGTASGKSYHLTGEAGDFSNGNGNTPQQLAFAQYMHDNYGGMLAELIYSAPGWKGNLNNGKPFDYGASTLSDHENHVHVAIDSDANGAGQPAPGTSSVTPYAPGSVVGSPGGATGLSATTGGANMGTPVGAPNAMGYTAGMVTDPYTGRQVRLGPEEYAKWQWDQQQQQKRLGDIQGDINRQQGELTDATNKLAQIQTERDTAWQEYEKTVVAIQNVVPGWMPGQPVPALAASEEYDKKLQALVDGDNKLKNATDAVNRINESISDKTGQYQDELNKPPERPKGSKDDLKGDANASALGKGLVSGIMQGLGFDGSVFENPLDWGIWKLFTGGVNYLGGLNKALKDQGGGGLFDPGGAGLLSGGPTGAGAAGDAGMSALTGLIPGVQSFLPEPGAPGSPTGGVPHAMQPTAGPGPAPDYGVAPQNGGINFNISGVPVDNSFIQNSIVNQQRQSPATAYQGNPSVVPAPPG